MIEPDTIGAQVVDGEGRRWVRRLGHGGPAPWWLVDAVDVEPWSVWSAIREPVVGLLSPEVRT